MSPASPTSPPPRLPRSFYERHTVEVARDLIGKLLLRARGDQLLVGRVVETEAYHGPEDAACHASRGRTPRTAPMFGPAGYAYVYQIYGMWCCLNAVTGPEDFPSAVLVRAVEPVAASFDLKAAAGPGKLCRQLDIDRALNRADLVGGQALWFADDGARVAPDQIHCGPRVGVDYAGAWAATPWRFWWAGNRSVSGKAGRGRG